METLNGLSGKWTREARLAGIWLLRSHWAKLVTHAPPLGHLLFSFTLITASSSFTSSNYPAPPSAQIRASVNSHQHDFCLPKGVEKHHSQNLKIKCPYFWRKTHFSEAGARRGDPIPAVWSAGSQICFSRKNTWVVSGPNQHSSQQFSLGQPSILQVPCHTSQNGHHQKNL